MVTKAKTKKAAPKKTTATVAFVGTGAVAKKTIAKAIAAAIENIGADEIKFVLPGSKALFTDTAASVHTYLVDNDIAYEMVCDEDGLKARGTLGPARKGAAKVHSVKRSVGDRIGKLLAAAGADGHFVLSIDDSEDADEAEAEKALLPCVETEAKCWDLSSAGIEVENPAGGDDEEEEAEEADDAEEEEEDEEAEEAEAEDEDEEEEDDEPEADESTEEDDDESSDGDIEALGNALLIAIAEAAEAFAKSLRKSAE